MFVTLSVILCHAETKSVDSMDEIINHFNKIDSNTLVVFDVDMVLIQPSEPAFQMANMKRYSTIVKRIVKEVPSEKHTMFFSLMTTTSDSVLVDPTTPQIINEIMKKGASTMAFTANLTGELGTIKNMQEWRVDCLKKLGVDFSKSAPYNTSLIFDDLPSYRNYYSTYSDGILFVNGTSISKGDIFLSFLNKTKISPNKIIFIDDREENVKSMDSSLQKLGRQVEYLGICYQGAQKYKSEAVSEEEFESKWQKHKDVVMETN